MQTILKTSTISNTKRKRADCIVPGDIVGDEDVTVGPRLFLVLSVVPRMWMIDFTVLNPLGGTQICCSTPYKGHKVL